MEKFDDFCEGARRLLGPATRVLRKVGIPTDLCLWPGDEEPEIELTFQDNVPVTLDLVLNSLLNMCFITLEAEGDCDEEVTVAKGGKDAILQFVHLVRSKDEKAIKNEQRVLRYKGHFAVQLSKKLAPFFARPERVLKFLLERKGDLQGEGEEKAILRAVARTMFFFSEVNPDTKTSQAFLSAFCEEEE